MIQKRRVREMAREKRDPGKHATEPGEMRFLLGEGAHLPQDVEEAARFSAGNGPNPREAFWKTQIGTLSI